MSSARYLRYVASLPCCHCGREAQAHHIIGIDKMGKMGSKASDLHTMPLCQQCHIEVHKSPSEWPQTKWMMNTQNQAVADGELLLK